MNAYTTQISLHRCVRGTPIDLKLERGSIKALLGFYECSFRALLFFLSPEREREREEDRERGREREHARERARERESERERERERESREREDVILCIQIHKHVHRAYEQRDTNTERK